MLCHHASRRDDPASVCACTLAGSSRRIARPRLGLPSPAPAAKSAVQTQDSPQSCAWGYTHGMLRPQSTQRDCRCNAADAARTKVQELLHEGQRAVICRGTTAARRCCVPRLSAAVGPAQVEWTLTRETPPDDPSAHTLRLTEIDFRMLNTSSLSMRSDVYTSISYGMHTCTQSRQVCNAAERRCRKCCQLASRCQANCRHHYDRALLKPAVCNTSCCNKSGLDCRNVQTMGRPPLCHRLLLPALSGSMPNEARPATTP